MHPLRRLVPAPRPATPVPPGPGPIGVARRACLGAVLGLAALAASAAAEHPAHVALDKLWERDAARAAKLGPYVAAHAAKFEPADAAYALALVQSRQGLHGDAEATLDAALARHPDAPALHRLRTYLFLSRRNRAEAIGQMARWASAMGRQPIAETAEYATLGTLRGFVGGPIGGGAEDPKLAELDALVEETSSPEQAAAYAGARQALLDRFAELGAAQRATAEARTEQDRKAREEAVAALQAEIDALTTKKSEAATAQAKAQQDAEASLKQKQDRLTEIRQQLAPAEAQIAVFQTQIASLSDQIRDYSSVLAANQNNALMISSTGFQIDNLRLQQAGLQQQIFAVQARVAPLNREATQLMNESQQTTVGREQTLGRLRKEAADADRRLASLRRKIEQEQAGRSGSRGDGPRVDVLSTYYSYPVDAERERLLALFADG